MASRVLFACSAVCSDLKYGANSIKLVSELMCDPALGDADRSRTKVLPNLTIEDFQSEFEGFLKGIGKDDTVLFYYCGHGEHNLSATNVFLRFGDDPQAGLISFETVVHMVALKCQSALFILDCCHSGAAFKVAWPRTGGDYGFSVLTSSSAQQKSYEGNKQLTQFAEVFASMLQSGVAGLRANTLDAADVAFETQVRLAQLYDKHPRPTSDIQGRRIFVSKNRAADSSFDGLAYGAEKLKPIGDSLIDRLDRKQPKLGLKKTAKSKLDSLIQEELVKRQKELEALTSADYFTNPEGAEVDLPGSHNTTRLLIQEVRQVLDIAVTGRSSLTASMATSMKSDRVPDLLADLLENDDPTVLLGDPGSGKSVTIRRLAEQICQSEKHQSLPRFPVIAPLGEFAPQGGNVDSSTVDAFIRSKLPERLRPHFKSLYESGRLIILFDSLDEMSRQNYELRLEVLAHYALRAKLDGNKSLFGCRINDFTKKLTNRILVVMPFRRHQVETYLRKYFHGHDEVLISSGEGKPVERLSLEDFALKIVGQTLTVDATNPYILRLLCDYVSENRRWPKNRVELVDSFAKKMIFTKCEESLPLFFKYQDYSTSILSNLAYQITLANRGNRIPANTIDEAIIHELSYAIKAGLVSDSHDGIGFIHHRLQEHFCAWNLSINQGGSDWTENLNYPRWRETLTNLAMINMSDAAEGAEIVSKLLDESIESLIETDKAIKEEPEEVQHRRSRSQLERQIADYFGLVCSLLRLSPSRLQEPAVTLRLACERAVESIADCGTPLLLARALHESYRNFDLNIDALVEKAKQSPFAYLVSQANIVELRSEQSGRISDVNLAVQLGKDIAKGTILYRKAEYDIAATDLGSDVISKKYRQARKVYLWQAIISFLILTFGSFCLLIPGVIDFFTHRTVFRERATGKVIMPAHFDKIAFDQATAFVHSGAIYWIPFIMGLILLIIAKFKKLNTLNFPLFSLALWIPFWVANLPNEMMNKKPTKDLVENGWVGYYHSILPVGLAAISCYFIVYVCMTVAIYKWGRLNRKGFFETTKIIFARYPDILEVIYAGLILLAVMLIALPAVVLLCTFIYNKSDALVSRIPLPVYSQVKWGIVLAGVVVIGGIIWQVVSAWRDTLDSWLEGLLYVGITILCASFIPLITYLFVIKATIVLYVLIALFLIWGSGEGIRSWIRLRRRLNAGWEAILRKSVENIDHLNEVLAGLPSLEEKETYLLSIESEIEKITETGVTNTKHNQTAYINYYYGIRTEINDEIARRKAAELDVAPVSTG